MSELDELRVSANVLTGALMDAAAAFRAANTAAGQTAQTAQTLHGGLGDLAHTLNEVDGLTQRWAGRARAVLEAAAAHERHVHAVTALGAAYDAVRIATDNSVSAEQALHAQQSLVQAGLRVSAHELATLTRAARDHAHAQGIEMPQALDQLVDALRGGEQEGLRRFNIAVRQGETDTHLLHRALGEMGAQMERGTPRARTLAEELALLNRNTTGVAGSFALLAARGLGLGGVLRDVNTLLEQLGNESDDAARRDRARAQGEHRNQLARNFNNQALVAGGIFGRDIGVRPDQLSDAQLERANATLSGSVSRPQYDALVAELQGAATANRGRNQSPFGMPGSGDAAPAGGERTGRNIGGGGGGGSNPLLALKAQLTEAEAEAVRRGVPIYRVPVTPGETLGHYWARLLQGQRDLNQLFPESNRMQGLAEATGVRGGDLGGMLTGLSNLGNGPSAAQMRAGGIARGAQIDRDARNPNGAFGGTFGGQLTDLLGRQGDDQHGFAAQADRTSSVAQNMAGAVTDSFHQMTRAAVDFVSAISSGADPAEALRVALHSLGEALMQKGLLRALEAGLEGTFRLASSYGADPTGYALLANAAAWGAVGLVGVGLSAATAPPRAAAAGASPGGAPAAARVNSPGGSDRRSGGGGGGVVINIDGHMITDRRTTEWLIAQGREAQRRQLGRMS